MAYFSRPYNHDSSSPPGDVESKVGGKTFTLENGAAICYNGFQFDDSIENALPHLTPVLTKAGKPRVNQPRVKATTAPFWKSQCILRGLPSGGSKAAMQDEVRKALAQGRAGMRADLKEAEARMKTEHAIRRAKAKARRDEERWIASSDDDRVASNPARFLEEAFRDAPDDHAVMVRNYDAGELHDTAKKLGLSLLIKSQPAPKSEQGQWPYSDSWTYIANSPASLAGKISEVAVEVKKAAEFREKMKKEAEALRKQEAKIREREEKEEEARKKQQAERYEKKLKTLQAQAAESSMLDDGTWDVTGTWIVDCKALDGYISDCEEYRMEMCIGMDGNKAQMYAKFDFGITTGIMRFVNAPADSAPTTGRKRKATSPHSSGNAKRADLEIEVNEAHDNANNDEAGDGEDDEDEDDDEDNDEHDYYRNKTSKFEPQFVLTDTLRPSAARPKLLFRWRGEETAEGVIELYSDRELNSITFSGPGGTSCSGTIEGGLFGDATFTGRKIKTGGSKNKMSYSSARVAAKGGWDERSEEAYERANRRRWGGW